MRCSERRRAGDGWRSMHGQMRILPGALLLQGLLLVCDELELEGPGALSQ